MEKSQTKRVPGLDVLRAVAILLVLGRHAPSPALSEPYWVREFAWLWGRCGWVGVDLFFVLSGFLVGGLLFKEYRDRGSLRLGRFFVRRAFKIYPAFYVFLFTALALMALRGGTFALRPLVGEVFFLQNYVGCFQGHGHTWSLAVEEHFYIAVGIVVLLFAKLGRGKADPFGGIIPLFVVVALVSLGLRLWTSVRLAYRDDTHLFPTHLRADSLFFGVLLAYLHHFRPHRLQKWVVAWRWPLLVGSTVLLLPAARWDADRFVMHTIGLTGLYLGFGGMVLLSVRWEAMAGKLAMTRLAGVGFYSYSIYLWHLFVCVKVWDHLGRSLPWLVCLVVYVVGAIVAGVLAAKVVEVPALRLRERLFPSRSGKPEPVREGVADDPRCAATELSPERGHVGGIHAD